MWKIALISVLMLSLVPQSIAANSESVKEVEFQWKKIVKVVRGITFAMNINEVEKVESAKLLKRTQEGNNTVLKYAVNKYNWYAELKYYFVEEKLQYIVFDFLPDQNKYYDWEKMTKLYEKLHTKIESELGEDHTFIKEDQSVLSSTWRKDGYRAVLTVNNKNGFTSATLVYYK